MEGTITPAAAAATYERHGVRKEYSGDGLKYLYSNVNGMLSAALKYNGVAYGGYVRDVVTRVHYNDFSAVSTKDVDVWFVNDESREKFVEEYKSAGLLRRTHSHIHVRASEGTNSVVMSLFDEYQSFLIYVDCVVSATFPVFDLDVNHLTYDPSTRRISSVGIYELPVLLNNIKSKECVPTSLCMRMLLSDDTTRECGFERHLLKKIRERVLERFVGGGWKLKDAKGKMMVLTCQCGAASREKCKCRTFCETPLVKSKA